MYHAYRVKYRWKYSLVKCNITTFEEEMPECLNIQQLKVTFFSSIEIVMPNHPPNATS